MRDVTAAGQPFFIRAYQREAMDVFYAGGAARGGSGCIVLPCGAGKTIVGMTVMSALRTSTLILTPNTVAVRQWIDELLDKTTLTPEDIGEYTGLQKQIRPVTVSTYQVMTYHKRKGAGDEGEFPHFGLFDARNWGLIIYDEVHLLPAPVFRITAELQARRRLGLTATLVREDGREDDVFSLIGPKKYDVPWKDLEQQGWIATANCHEVRIPLEEDWRMELRAGGSAAEIFRGGDEPAQIPGGGRAAAQACRRADADHRHVSGAVACAGRPAATCRSSPAKRR